MLGIAGIKAVISYFFATRPSKQDVSTIPSRYRKINNGLILGHEIGVSASEWKFVSRKGS
jgi:hypothetical protein